MAAPDGRLARGATPARGGPHGSGPGNRAAPPDPLMGVSAPLLSAAGVIAAVVAMMVDGRRAVAIAVAFLAAGLAPTAATFGGAPGAAVLGACGIAALVLAWAGWLGGRVLPWLSGLDPTIPAFAPAARLFGPRSARAFGAAVAVPIASWVSFN